MKQHITVQDLQALSDAQKQNLRYLWVPEKNDVAAASICVNVETDDFQDIEFVIGEIIVDEHHRGMTLRRLRLLDDTFFEENQELFENEGSFELEYAEPEQYFNKEDCLPLMSVGQMIQFLRNHKYAAAGFKLTIPGSGSKVFADEMSFTLEDNMGEADSDSELCDLLWRTVKTVL